MGKHTPGPWGASEGHPSDVWHVDMPNRWYSVIVSRGEDDWDMPVEEVQANARLIAAAPDLLAAAIAMQCVDVMSDTEVGRARDLLDAAIAKAKGGE